MNPILIQIIGFIGLFFIIISFQKNQRSFTLKSQIFSACFFAVHFFFLNAWTGAAMNTLGSIRAYVFKLRDSKKWLNNNIVMYLFILFFWLAGWLTWQGRLSLLPVFSMTLECFSLWNKKTKHIRWLFLSARPGWIIYNFLVGSYAGLITEAFVVMSIIIAIIRFDIFKKKE